MSIFLHNDAVAVVAVGKALSVAATSAARATEFPSSLRKPVPLWESRLRRLLQDLAAAISVATLDLARLRYNQCVGR